MTLCDCGNFKDKYVINEYHIREDKMVKRRVCRACYEKHMSQEE